MVVGVRRPHDGHREAAVPVGGDQPVLAGDLVPGVLPVRVAERRRLGHRHPGRGLLVRGRGADEHVLAGAVGEAVDVGADVVGGEGAELRHRVERAVAEGPVDGRAVGRVGLQQLDLLREGSGAGPATVQDRDPMTLLHGQLHAARADHAAAADEQDALRVHLGILALSPQSVTRRILSSLRPGSRRPSVLLVVTHSEPSGAG